MGGYQSDNVNSGFGLDDIYWKYKGSLDVSGDQQPFPIGVRNDTWTLVNQGLLGGIVQIEDGDILYCIGQGIGGMGAQGAAGWIVIPHKRM